MPQGASNKKKYTYVWVSAVILVFGIFTVVEITRKLESGSIRDTNRMTGSSLEDRLSYIVINGERRRVPQFKLIDQDSSLVTDRDLLGKVYVVDFIFTTCPTICPKMTANMAELKKAFKNDDNFGLASITINPRYDTPSILAEYKKRWGPEIEGWHFLTGQRDSIFDLAQKGFNIYVNEEAAAPGGFEHSGMFALIDKRGFLRSRLDRFGNPLIYYRGTISEAEGVNDEGEPQQITMLKEDIKRLLQE